MYGLTSRPLQDQDAIDFTDNDITILSNFPLSPRLRTLLLARNRVNSIQPTLATSIPNLTTLVLTSNNFAELADLDALRHFSKLTHLSLLENPVTRREVRRTLLIRKNGGYGQMERKEERADKRFSDIALPPLDHMALSQHPLPRLPKSRRR